MDIKNNLRIEPKLQQGLILSQEMLLSLELLSMPLLDLCELVKEEMRENIFLEEVRPVNLSSLFDSDEDEKLFWERLPARTDWREEVVEQIVSLRGLGDEEVGILLKLLLYIDDRGFLVDDLENIATSIGCSPGLLERLRLVLMEYVEPEGIGAKNFDEFLNFQLKRLGILSSSDIEEDIGSLKGRIKPYPLYGFNDGEATVYVVPDAYVVQVGDEFQVHLNEGILPVLSIREEYRSFIDSSLDKEVRDYLREKFKRAQSIIKAIEQRKKTLRKTIEAIVELEREFFEKGPSNVKPLNLQQLAEKLDLHISTVSRIVNSKYIHTPWGTFPLKIFFEDKGFEIKKRIRELIENEPKDNPLTDEEICEILKREGYSIARRTVTKYREELSIPSCRKRRVKDAGSDNRKKC